MSMYFMLLRGFPALFRLFWLGKFHHSTTRFRTCLRNRAHRPFLAPWCALPHPLQNRVPRGAGHLWRSAAPVSAPRLGRCWALPTGEQHPRPSPSAPATKPAKTLGFRRFSFCTCCMGMGFTLVQTLGFPIRSHLFPTAATPSSTQNAPDFSYFRLKSGAFRCFCLLLTCKNFVPVFLRHPGFPAIHIDSF